MVKGIGVVKHTPLGVLPALPVAAHQHLAATGGARGGEGGAVFERDVVSREDDAPALAGQTAGVDASAVAHHTALQLARGHGGEDDQAAFGFNGLLVVHQGLPLAGFYADVGEAVVGVDLQLHHFACSQRYRALGGHNQALVAHFGGHEGDVAL